MPFYQEYDFSFTAEASEEFERLSPTAIRAAIIRSLAVMSDAELMEDIRLNTSWRVADQEQAPRMALAA